MAGRTCRNIYSYLCFPIRTRTSKSCIFKRGNGFALCGGNASKQKYRFYNNFLSGYWQDAQDDVLIAVQTAELLKRHWEFYSYLLVLTSIMRIPFSLKSRFELSFCGYVSIFGNDFSSISRIRFVFNRRWR